MQETKRFKAADGKTVLVEVNSKKGNKTAVLMVHGFTGYINEHIFFNAAKQWPLKGFDVWRISLYPGEFKGTRTMATVTWAENLKDIDLTLRKMAKAYGRLFIIGHSVGGTQAVYAGNSKLGAKVLWDPQCESDLTDGATQKDLHPDYYTIDWGKIILARKGYAHEVIGAAKYAPESLPANQPPTLVIQTASDLGVWPMERLSAKLVKMQEADHGFNHKGNEEKLFRLTLKFFNDVLSVSKKAGMTL